MGRTDLTSATMGEQSGVYSTKRDGRLPEICGQLQTPFYSQQWGAHHTKCTWNSTPCRPQVEWIRGGGVDCSAGFPSCNHTLCPVLDDAGAASG